MAGHRRRRVPTTLVLLLAAVVTAGLATADAEAALARTLRVTLSTNGIQAKVPASGGAGIQFSMTPDGRFVAFESAAGNLVPPRSAPTGASSSSTASLPTWCPGHQRGERRLRPRPLVPFDQPGEHLRRRRPSQRRQRAPMLIAAITNDGRRAAFASDATNLVPGDTNGIGDIFVHQLRR